MPDSIAASYLQFSSLILEFILNQPVMQSYAIFTYAWSIYLLMLSEKMEVILVTKCFQLD